VIVVDTNVIAFLLLPGDHTAAARNAWRRDPTWAAPVLWRSELRSVLATSLRLGHLDLTDAVAVMETAADLMAGGEFEPRSDAVLALTARSRCSAYDCEFVALAQELGVALVTADRQILADFAETAVALSDYGRTG
jgi:predicted nucleic acid-binding protein